MNTAHDKFSSGLRLTTVNNMVILPRYRDAFTKSSVRHLIFEATPRQDSKGNVLPTNGLVEAGAIVRVGRKVLIDLDAFDAWLNGLRTPTAQGEHANAI